MTSARFGPAGTSGSFAEKGYRRMLQTPEYLREFGLTAYEYQCGHGLRVNEGSVRALGEALHAAGIAPSLHAPYYISLSSVEEEKRDKSVGYILQSAQVAAWLGARRFVVHAGSCGKISREEALVLAKDTLLRARYAMDEAGFEGISICPETMGKVNQLGTLEEVLELCRLDERMIPCIDFGHLNARTFGGIRNREDYAAILDAIGDSLGRERLAHFHAHFSKIAYTPKGGEKAHLTFADTLYGPQYESLLDLVAQRGLSPIFICESAGTQAEDAREMKEYYETQRK